MRDYGAVSPRFWIGTTGKQLRGKTDAQLLALYLMTSPHARMTGVYHLPMAYIVADTGMTLQGASKALQCLIEAQFCEYDADSDTIFVVQMALYQIGERLDPKDKRVIGLRKEVERMAGTRMQLRFLAVHGVRFGLVSADQIPSPIEGASKALPSQDQEQDQEQDQKITTKSGEPDVDPGDDDGKQKPLAAERRKAELREEAKAVLAFLNKATGSSFQPVDSNLRLIAARLDEYDAETARRVIADRWERWSTDAKMAEYLRPLTLFAAANFANYAGQLPATHAPEQAHA